jgi:PAS domain S-box-containing protein
LRDSDARFNALADALPHMVWSTLPDGFHDYYNQRWYEFTGMPLGSTDGEAWNGMFHPDDQEKAWRLWRHSLETGEPYQIEYRLRHHTGEYRWTLGRALPIRDGQGRIVRWMGTCTDIHEAKQHADQVEILSRELSHRIKNIFAVIRSLISLSARQQPEHKGFAERVKQRITALGRAHEFVRPHSEESRPQVAAITFHGLVGEILAPYPALDEGRIAISGDDLTVDDRSATPLALLIHELATNATKYGALASENGEVSIVTKLDADAFSVGWTERGGSPVSRPDRTGFGTMLCEISMRDQLGGEIEWIWDPAGLSVQVTVPNSSFDRGVR